MTELLNLVLQAHGGIERWRLFDTVRATFSSSGGLLPLKGLDITPQPTEGVATIHEETLRIDGYLPRFPNGGGWGYALFNYDAASDTFTPDASPDNCGHACRTAVKAKDYIFHPYQRR